jgi:hypothetical protein
MGRGKSISSAVTQLDLNNPVAARRRTSTVGTFSKDWRDEKNIQMAIGSICQGREAFPRQADFKDAGLLGLYHLLREGDSLEGWAEEMGLPYKDEDIATKLQRSHWTEEEIRNVLEPLCLGRKTFPTKDEFELAGLLGLYTYLHNRNSLHEWADEMSLYRAKRPRWTDEVIEAELKKICRGRNNFPRGEDFRQAGIYAMYSKMMTSGRLSEWQEKMGLEPYESPFS